MESESESYGVVSQRVMEYASKSYGVRVRVLSRLSPRVIEIEFESYGV